MNTDWRNKFEAAVIERDPVLLSSGEGLIAAVADHDETATDRRLFVLQPELASNAQSDVRVMATRFRP